MHVRKFHEAFDLDAPTSPTPPSAELAALRMRLMTEEYKEVKAEAERLLALLRSGANPQSDHVVSVLQAFVKEVCDLKYVADGTLVALGVEPAYDEVHRSNMSKLGEDGKPVRREDGKVLKGPNYKPVDPEKMFPSSVEGTYEEEGT